MPDVGGESTPAIARAPVFPMAVKIAGITWIAFGSLFLLAVLGLIVWLFGMAASGNREANVYATVFLPMVPCAVPFGLLFLYIGIQTARGKARDTFAFSIGSIFFGVVFIFPVILDLVVAERTMESLLQSLLGFLLLGFPLVGAGTLALYGRRDYKAWRQA